MPRGCVISDIHYFARRSAFDRHRSDFLQAIQTSEVVVLNGDIFDFRWSRVDALTSTISYAIDWLIELIESNPQADFYFVAGNHDSQPAFLDALNLLSQQEPRFSWQPYQLQLGTHLFLHGDIVHSRTIDALDRYRRTFHKEGVHLLRFDSMYQLLHHLRVPLMLSYLHSTARLASKLDALLAAGVIPFKGKVTDIYFGHVHRPFTMIEHKGRRYHNTGAVLQGMKWNILTFDVTDTEVLDE